MTSTAVIVMLVSFPIALGAVGFYVYLQNQRIELLGKQLATYANASINVANQVSLIVENKPIIEQASQCSRRWLIQEAKRRLKMGDPLSEIAKALKLEDEEKNLLLLQQQYQAAAATA